MSDVIVCDGCGRDIQRHTGKKWAAFKRKYRYRVLKWRTNARRGNVRYDFCNNCWDELINSVQEKANADP